MTKPVLRHRVRADYNENHDEQGRFAVSSSSSGASGYAYRKGVPFNSREAAKSHAREASKSAPKDHFHVRKDEKIIHAYHKGQEVDPVTHGPLKSAHGVKAATREGAAKAGAAVRALQAKGGQRAGTAKAAEHEALRQSILKQQAARVAPDVKSSESLAGAKMRDADRKDYDKSIHTNAQGQELITGPKFAVTQLTAGGSHFVVKEGGSHPMAGPFKERAAASVDAETKNKERAAKIDKHMGTTATASKIGEGMARAEAAKALANRSSAESSVVSRQERSFDKKSSEAKAEQLGMSVEDYKKAESAFDRLSARPNTPRTLSARHLAPKGEPTRAEREAAYAKRSTELAEKRAADRRAIDHTPFDISKDKVSYREKLGQTAERQRLTDQFNETKQNHTGGGSLKAYLAKHMK